MKLIIAGGRDCNSFKLLLNAIKELEIPVDAKTEIVSGMAKGADTLGCMYAEEFDLKLHKFPAQWDLHGRKAGPLRNIEMAKFADSLLALWDGKSKGTKHMIDEATKRGLKVWVYKYTENDIIKPEPVQYKGL